MSLDLADFENKTNEAVRAFWGNREAARLKQVESGKADQGERAGVTAGKNMDGFIALAKDIVRQNGLVHAEIYFQRTVNILPGHFRPIQYWDILVLNEKRLIAAIEFKSQLGPSFGGNFNSLTNEVICNAMDLWATYRKGGFGEYPRPFVGWLMLLEDCENSRSPVHDNSPHFGVLPENKNASYAQRYNILCSKLVRENLYTSATLLLSPRSAVDTGAYTELSELTGLKSFVTTFAGHIADEAARSL